MEISGAELQPDLIYFTNLLICELLSGTKNFRLFQNKLSRKYDIELQFVQFRVQQNIDSGKILCTK